MSQEENIETITVGQLQEKARAMHEQGQRLVQISATRLPEEVELTYSFDLNYRLSNLRLIIPGTGSHLPSISSIYGCAILYENEIHDLFNVKVDGLTVDFGGNFYKTSVKFPFDNTKAPSCAVVPADATPAPAEPQ